MSCHLVFMALVKSVCCHAFMRKKKVNRPWRVHRARVYVLAVLLFCFGIFNGHLKKTKTDEQKSTKVKLVCIDGRRIQASCCQWVWRMVKVCFSSSYCQYHYLFNLRQYLTFSRLGVVHSYIIFIETGKWIEFAWITLC